jgi:hypothetical protein
VEGSFGGDHEDNTGGGEAPGEHFEEEEQGKEEYEE